ncbi:MAG: metallophosphoesterase family protein, partial [Candidatus Omnitrophica bacterium]|nr:metallophosphoesterase family protein [Candidatus Omnitrophota bacterium]
MRLNGRIYTNTRCGIMGFQRRPLKVMAVITLWSFLLSIGGGLHLESAGADIGLTEVPAVSSVDPTSPSFFDIPDYLGQIKDSWQGDSDKFVIHIQDAHCNYDCQHAIAELIDHFRVISGVNIVNLEGGTGEYDFSDFMGISDALTRQKTADHFVENGQINGAEYYAITNPKRVKLWGIEDVKLYTKNLQAYRLTDKNKEDIDNYIKRLILLTEQLKGQYYSEKLLILDENIAAYKNDNVKVKDFLSFIKSKAKEENVSSDAYNAVGLLEQAFNIEKNIDFDKAEKQRAAVIEKMCEHLSKDDSNILMQRSLQFKTGQISSGDFYAYMFEKIKFLNIDISQYNEFNKYGLYVDIYTKIDKDMLYEQIVDLSEEVKSKVFQNDKQKYINDLSLKIELLDKLFNACITKQEYRLYKQKGWIALIKYLLLLKTDVSQEDIAIVQELQEFIPLMESFYEYSYKRDDIFIENLKFSRNRHLKKEAALLITGGFHTENLFDKFRKNGISYISIQPSFKIEKDQKNMYFDLLKGSTSSISQIVSVNVSSLAIFSYLTEHAKDVYSEDVMSLWKMSIQVVADLIQTRQSLVVIDKAGKTLVFSFDASGNTVEGCIVDGKQVFVKEKTVAEAVLLQDSKVLRAEIAKQKDEYVLEVTQADGNIRFEKLEQAGELNALFFIHELNPMLTGDKYKYRDFILNIYNIIKNEQIPAYVFLEPIADIVAINSEKFKSFAFLTGLQDEEILILNQVLDYLAKRKNIWFEYEKNTIKVYRRRGVGRFFMPKRFSVMIGEFDLSEKQKQMFDQRLQTSSVAKEQTFIRAVQNVLFEKEDAQLTRHIQSFLKTDMPEITDIKINDPKLFLMIDIIAAKLQRNMFLYKSPEKEYFYPIAYTRMLELFAEEEIRLFLKKVTVKQLETSVFFIEKIFLDEEFKSIIKRLKKYNASDILYRLFFTAQVFNEINFWNWKNLSSIIDLVEDEIDQYWDDIFVFMVLQKSKPFYSTNYSLPMLKQYLQSKGGEKLGVFATFFMDIFNVDKTLIPLFASMINNLTYTKSPAQITEQMKFVKDWTRTGSFVKDTGFIKYFSELSNEQKKFIIDNEKNIWQEISDGNFDSKKTAHIVFGYKLLTEQLKRSSQKGVYITFDRYLNVLDTNEDIGFSEKEIAEMKYLAYESKKVKEFLNILKQKSETLGVPLVVVENMSYGWIAALAVEDEIQQMGIRMIRTKAGSTAAHDNPTVMHGANVNDDADLFSQEDMEYIVQNNPIVAVIDGSYSLDPETTSGMARQFERYADAHQAYRNWFYAISRDPDNNAFGINGLMVDSNTGQKPQSVSDALKLNQYYTSVRNRADSIATNREDYSMFFWYPGRKKMSICSQREKRDVPFQCDLTNINDPQAPYIDKIKGPSLVWINANLENDMIPEQIRSGKNGRSGVKQRPDYHNSAFWDDVKNRDSLYFVITKTGPQLRLDDFESSVKKYYKEVMDMSPGETNVAEQADHDIFHIKGDFSSILFRIGQELNIKGIDVVKKIREKLDGRTKIIKTENGSVRSEQDGIIVIIDSRFKKDHAGRSLSAVYARNEAKAQHELAELRGWIEFAKDNGIATDEEIEKGLLASKLKTYFGLLATSSKELRQQKQAELKGLIDKFHQKGIEAEQKVEQEPFLETVDEVENIAIRMMKMHKEKKIPASYQNKFSGGSFTMHGTNAQTLRSVLNTEGKLLSNVELDKRGIKILSGENMGTSSFNKNLVSALSIIGGYFHNAEQYAKNCADGKLAVTPSNVEYRIQKAKQGYESLLKVEHESGPRIASEIKRLDDFIKQLENIRKYFNGLSEGQKEEIEANSKIPVVLYGYHSGKKISPVFSDFSGELGYDQITVTHVATTLENMDKIRTLLRQYNRTDIEVITYQQAVKLNDYYKAYYEKMFFEGNEQDFIIASDGAYDPFEYFEEYFSFIDKELLDKRIEGLDLWQKKLEENSFEEYAVIPDVHGDVNALNRVLDDLSKKGVKKFIFLGDYFDRGKNNLEVFDRVKQLKEQGNVVCLMGNHDVMFIKAVLYEDFESFERWFYNGGYAFLDNVFGEAIIYEEIDEKSFERIISNEKMQTIAKWLLENLDLYHITDTGVMFIHAGMDINDYFFPGNIEITYDEQFGIKALELMQKDLRLGGVLAKRVISYLDEDYDSVVWVRNRWLSVFDRIGDPSLLVDAVLDQLGVNMIVFGHTVQKDNMPKIIADRIMGIDLAMSEEMNEGKGTGGFGIFSGKGIFIDNFNFDGTIQDNEVLSKEALLDQIKKEKELLKRKLDKEYKVASGYPVRSNVLEGVNATKLSGGHIAFKGTQQEEVNSDKLLSDSTDIVKKVLNNIYPQNASTDTDDAQNTKVIAIGIKDISQVKAIADSIDTMEKKKLLQLIR